MLFLEIGKSIIMSSISPRDVRKLVDKLFSLQWCRDNLVVPLSEENFKRDQRYLQNSYCKLLIFREP
ncbi:MAG: hypothetical protein CM15mP15_0090 [Prochlorococcus sp.]|nr:MAG: hypothetical protein CM15mP15_0090 [Prochlorococcus sp.]